MSTSRSSRSRRTKSSDPASTLPILTTTKNKKSSPYDRNFDLHLTEHAIHPTYRSREPNLEEARASLTRPRPSLSPSRFSEGAFKAFQRINDQAKDEDDVVANVIPTILGGQTNRFCARNTVFNNLEPLTDGRIVAPNPNIYWGSYPKQLARSARNELAGHIIPSTMMDKPMAPNCFMEVKGPDGSLAVAKRQARHIGASGSRGMHSLQNYGIEELQYDGRPCTFNATYHGGHLQLYAHHMTAPTIEGGRPEYHMTQLRSFSMTDTRDTFADGAGALRNTIELAEKYRTSFIEKANARASRSKVAAKRDRTNNTEAPQSEDESDELAPSFPHTAQVQDREESPDELASSPTRYAYEDDESQDLPEVEPPTSLNTSFTSSFSQYQSRSKRQGSPPSDAAETTKPRLRNKREGKSVARGSKLAGSPGSLQVRTYLRKENVCFLDAEKREVRTAVGDWREEVLDDGKRYYSWQSTKSRQVYWTLALATVSRKHK